MRLKKSEYYGPGLNVLLTSIYIWYLFRTVLMAPAHALLSSSGDGTKNSYTYIYHAIFGKGFHFEGMNYPWGEHVSFTDNQPALAFFLACLNPLFHFSINDLLLILNLLIPISFIITSFILCKFLIRQGVNQYLAALFSLLITFLAPNFYRVFGHFGLTYTFNIALTIYWLFQYHTTRKKWYLTVLFLLNVFMAFIHMYNLLFGMLILFFYAIANLLLEKEKIKKRLTGIIPILIVIAMSFVSVKLIFIITDHVKDRPQTPWGILESATTLRQIFTSEYSPLGKAFSLLFNGYVSSGLDEGYAYMGMIPLLYVLFILVNCILYFFRKREFNLYCPISNTERYLLIMGCLSFLMTIGFPFIFGMSFLLDYIPAIKQFRCLGRISLITYFCIGIACVIRISTVVKYFTEKKMYAPVIYFLFACIILWSFEIFGYSKYLQRRLDESQENYKNVFHHFTTQDNGDLLIQKDTNYQCIMGIPLYVIGSEKVGKDVDSEFSGDLFNLSLRKQLPIVNVLMSRSSWKQSFQLMRLAGGEFTDKTFFTESLNKKKIFLVRLKEAVMTQDELNILSYADSIGEEGRLEFYNLDWQKLIHHQKAKIDSLNKIQINQFQFANENNFTKSFDENKTKEKLFGKGALDIRKTDCVVLFDKLLNMHSKTTFEFSLWTLVQSNDYRMPYCNIELFDSNGNVASQKKIHTANATDNIGFWFRTSAEIEMDSNIKRIRIVFKNEDKHPGLYVDEFLFKPVPALIAKENDEKTYRMYNNHLIKLNP